TTTLATFTDPAGPEATTEYTVVVNWGDGSSADTITPTFSGGTFTVSGSHTYAEEGTFTVSVQILHGTAPNVTVTSTALLAHQQLTSLTGPTLPASGTEGTALNGGAIGSIATFVDPAGVGAASDYTASINWGDGTTSAGTIVLPASGNTITVSAGDHIYTEEGFYTVTVTVQHGSLPALSA